MRLHPWSRFIALPRLQACLALAGLVLAAGLNPASAASVPLPVPRITLYPGDAIQSEHLSERAFNAGLPRRIAVHQDSSGLVGKVARRTLLPGQPIPINAVREPHIVTQGRTVQIVFQNGPLTITGYAVALQSGGVGDIVSIRNADSGIIVKGIVRSDGTIQVGAL